MPKYKKVNYKHVCDMIKTITTIRGEPQSLKELVSDLSSQRKLGIDTVRVCQMLGDKIVEKVEEVPIYGKDGNYECTLYRTVTMVKP